MQLISFRTWEFHCEHQFDRTNRYLVRSFGTRWPALEEEKPAARSAAVRQRPAPSDVATVVQDLVCYKYADHWIRVLS